MRKRNIMLVIIVTYPLVGCGDRSDVIVPGVGWKTARIGATTEEVESGLGPARTKSWDDNPTGSISNWNYPVTGVQVGFPEFLGRVAHVTFLEKGTPENPFDQFHGKTREGIKIGSTMAQVVDAYGEPVNLSEDGYSFYIYDGIMFGFENERVSVISIIPLKGSETAIAIQEHIDRQEAARAQQNAARVQEEAAETERLAKEAAKRREWRSKKTAAERLPLIEDQSVRELIEESLRLADPELSRDLSADHDTVSPWQMNSIAFGHEEKGQFNSARYWYARVYLADPEDELAEQAIVQLREIRLKAAVAEAEAEVKAAEAQRAFEQMEQEAIEQEAAEERAWQEAFLATQEKKAVERAQGMLRTARVLESTNRDGAMKYYQEIIRDRPGTPEAEAASARLEDLQRAVTP